MTMKLFSIHHILISIVTFVILFLMNYLGSPYADRLSRALLTAVAGVVGLSIGLFIIYKNKDGKPFDEFD